jgi:outer membrane immunogenic protein
MTMIKRLLLRTTALPALLVGHAMAADMAVKALPPAPAFSWTGFYVGLNAGGDWTRSDPGTSASCAIAPGFFASYFGCGSIPTVNALDTGSMSGGGFTGGAQAGYNLQFNSTVVGVEADFNAFRGHASRTATGALPGAAAVATITNSVDADWLFTARGRLGWALNNSLLAYATGGLALTHMRVANSYSDNAVGVGPGVGNWNAAATKAGWAAGGGVEWAFAQNWSIRGEYLYVHFDAISASGVVGTPAGAGYGSAISTSTDLSAHIARGGVNYKF